MDAGRLHLRASAKSGRPKSDAECGYSRQSECQDESKSGPRGFDGATLIKGRKRHVLVDTLGLILKVIVSEASVGDREGAAWLLLAIVGLFTRLKLIWVDGGYAGVDFAAWVKRWIGVRLAVVEHDPNTKGFQKLPRRWVVERTLAWLNSAGRLSKDYEFHLQSSEAMIYAAMIALFCDV
jgi:putative transposase